LSPSGRDWLFLFVQQHFDSSISWVIAKGTRNGYQILIPFFILLFGSSIKKKSYNREAYLELKEFISRTSLNDAEIFCEKLMRESPRLKGLGKSSSFLTTHCFTFLILWWNSVWNYWGMCGFVSWKQTALRILEVRTDHILIKLSFHNMCSKGILTLSDELMRLQVRSAYVKNEFEWDNLKELSFKVRWIFINLLLHLLYGSITC
jgi:hypothetical protein